MNDGFTELERRRAGRVYRFLKAELLIEGRSYAGYIENFSIDGMRYYIDYFFRTPTDFSPRRMFTLKIMPSAGELLNIQCELVWFKRLARDNDKLMLGMKVINPPEEYVRYVNSLNSPAPESGA